MQVRGQCVSVHGLERVSENRMKKEHFTISVGFHGNGSSVNLDIIISYPQRL